MFFNITVFWLTNLIFINLLYGNISFSDKEEGIAEEGEESDVETAQEKRLRLAKQYLAQLESEGNSLMRKYFSF